MKLPGYYKKQLKMAHEYYQAELDNRDLQIEQYQLSHELMQREYINMMNATEEAMNFVEKLWNLLTMKQGSKILDMILDDALPLLKKHSHKYDEVDVEEAQANVRADVQTS